MKKKLTYLLCTITLSALWSCNGPELFESDQEKYCDNVLYEYYLFSESDESIPISTKGVSNEQQKQSNVLKSYIITTNNIMSLTISKKDAETKGVTGDFYDKVIASMEVVNKEMQKFITTDGTVYDETESNLTPFDPLAAKHKHLNPTLTRATTPENYNTYSGGIGGGSANFVGPSSVKVVISAVTWGPWGVNITDSFWGQNMSVTTYGYGTSSKVVYLDYPLVPSNGECSYRLNINATGGLMWGGESDLNIRVQFQNY